MELMSDPQSEYFEVRRRRTKPAGSKWRAAAIITRKDTDEEVAVLSAKATTSQAAERELQTAIEAHLKTLHPPLDWGKDPTVPHLMQRYTKVNDHLYGIVLRAEAAAEPARSEIQREAEVYKSIELGAIRDMVAQLSEAQRIELATPTKDQIAHVSDARVLDALTVKKRLTAMIPDPSPAVQDGYKRLDSLLNQ